MTQIILFDVDGVLIHGYHAREELRNCWDETMEEDLGISRQVFKDEFIFKSFINEVLIGKKDLKDALNDFLLTIEFDGQAQDVIDYWLEKDSHVNHDLFEVIKVLKKNPDARLFIATNQEHNRAKYLMHSLGFNEHFEDIFHSAKIGYTKPDLNYFKRVDEMLGYPENPPIFFDDTPKVVEAAKEYGWIAHEYYNLESLKKDDFVRKVLG